MRKQAFFKLNVINLLQVDDLCLFQRLQCNWLTLEEGKVNFTERASANDTQQVIVSDLSLAVLHTATIDIATDCSDGRGDGRL